MPSSKNVATDAGVHTSVLGPTGSVAQGKDAQPILFHSSETGSGELGVATSVDQEALAAASAGAQGPRAAASSAASAGSSSLPLTKTQVQVTAASFANNGSGTGGNTNSPGSAANMPVFSNPA